MKYELNKKQLLIELKAYRDNMSEFGEEEMDYLIDLVDRDIELEESINIG